MAKIQEFNNEDFSWRFGRILGLFFGAYGFKSGGFGGGFGLRLDSVLHCLYGFEI